MRRKQPPSRECCDVAVDQRPATPDLVGLRATEFSRLDRHDEVYLDYTGSALYAESHVARHAELLQDSVLGNPHSDSPASRASSGYVDEARARVLRFFDADPSDYAVCFTANATGALRVVGESYPFSRRSRLVLTADNHNSVNGIRELARRAGATVVYVGLDDELRVAGVEDVLRAGPPGLFAFPAQSNFSGAHHPLRLVCAAQELGYDVLLDAASYVSAHRLSLRAIPADFVALSFYKMFGYPTGIGALIARHAALERLHRPWFAGGTIEVASVQLDTHELKRGPEAFEDGTVSFTALPALGPGFDLLESIGMGNIHEHVRRLTALLIEQLGALRHSNGRPIVHLYGPRSVDRRGGTVAFNVLDGGGRVVPYATVESGARAVGVSVRGGCFCNPGAAEHAFGFPPDSIGPCLAAGRSGGAFSVERFARCMEPRAVGALRASLGLANNERDVRRAVAVVAAWRDQNFTANAR